MDHARRATAHFDTAELAARAAKEAHVAPDARVSERSVPEIGSGEQLEVTAPLGAIACWMNVRAHGSGPAANGGAV
jgi:hypothetical protein